MLPGMSDVVRVSTALRWSGRLLAVAGVVYGVLPDGDCGSAFFPDSGVDGLTGVLCTDVVSGRQDAAVVLLVLGVAVMVAGQVLGWRRKPDER
jgi:hypothetical protein